MAKQFLRPSTYKNYKVDEYERHFKHRLGNLRLRDFRTAHGQRLLSAISKDNPELGHKTLLRLKSFLSGVFRHARAEGYLDEQNPMRDVSLPRTVRRVKFRGDTYTLPEITALLTNVNWPDYVGRVAFAAVATAAFTVSAWPNCAAYSGGTSLVIACPSNEQCGVPARTSLRRNQARIPCQCCPYSVQCWRTTASTWKDPWRKTTSARR
jgi:hypothetical protein